MQEQDVDEDDPHDKEKYPHIELFEEKPVQFDLVRIAAVLENINHEPNLCDLQ